MDDDSLFEAQTTVQAEQHSFSTEMTEKISLISSKHYLVGDMKYNSLSNKEFWPEYFRLLGKLCDCLNYLDQQNDNGMASRGNNDLEPQPADDGRNLSRLNDETTSKYVHHGNKLIVQLFNVQSASIKAYAKTLGYPHDYKQYLQSSDDDDDIAADDYDYEQNPYYRCDIDDAIGPFSSSAILGCSEKGGYHRDERVCNGKYEFDEMKYLKVLSSFNDRISQFVNSLKQECGYEQEEVSVESKREEDVQVCNMYF